MKKFTTLLLVFALTLSMVLSVVPLGIFADTATELTDNSGYSGGIRKKSDGSILFSPFMASFKELIDAGADITSYTIDMTFTQLDGSNGNEVHTFDTVSAAINKSNGYYYDIYLNGKLGNSGFCPTAEKFYNVYVEIYQNRTANDKGIKVFYGTYKNMQAASAISGSTYYDPTPIPVDAPQITETTEGYEGNISYKGEGIRKRSAGQISFCPYITELRALVDAGAKPSDFTAELTFNLLSEKDGEVTRTFDSVKVTPENGTGYFYLTLADGNGNCGFIPTAGEYYDIEVKIFDSEGKLATYGTYKSTPAQAAIADSPYYSATPLTVQITETKDDYTGTKLYKNGIRLNSSGAIMVSAFMTELRAAVNAGKSADSFTIKTVFTLLDEEGKEVATFPEVTLTPNKTSNGQYFDIPLKGSGFCPTAGSYYNIQMNIYEDGVLKYYGTYKNIVALDAIADCADYMPTPVPGAPTDYEISLSYSFNNTLKGSAAGTIYFSVDRQGYFELTWGDKDGKPLTVTVGSKTLTYSELTKFNVTSANGGSFAEKVIAFTAIPQGAETLIVLDGAENVVKTLALPTDKLQSADEYTFSFGAISDLHYEYFYTDGVDDAIYAVDTALAFYEAVGAKLVVATGDFSKYTEEAAYQKYQTAVGKVTIPVIACGGNHEVYGISADKMFAADGYWRTYVNNGVYDATMEGVLDVADNGIDFAYSYPGLEDYVFVSLSQWKWDGHSATQDCLVTDSQLLWMEEMFETYKDKTVYLLFHTYLGDDDYESIDGEGDMTNPGGYTYGAFYNKYTKDEKVFRALLDQYENVIWFNGHSHYEYNIQKYNENLNIFDYMGTTATMIHVPSVTNARTLTDSSTNYSNTHGTMSQGALMFVYDGYQIMNGVDLWGEEILSYACYIVYDDKTGIVEDGTIEGTEITWTWDAQLNSLRVLGTGEMPDFDTTAAPWADYMNDIMTVYVGKGITRVGNDAFAGASKLQTVELKDDVAEIGKNAFAKTVITKLVLPEGLKKVDLSAFGGVPAINEIIYGGSKASFAKIDIAEDNAVLGGTINYRKFNITWDVNGEITNEEFKVGEVPVFDGVPTKNHTNPNKHYIFTGWSNGSTTYTGALPKVTGEATYTAVFGNEVDRYVTGTLSDGNIIWTVDRTLGTLTISGTGDMPSWKSEDRRPWASYNADIYKAIVKSGITSVGSFSFSKMEALQTVVLEEGITKLNADAMSYNEALTTVYLPSTLTFIGQGVVYQSNNVKTVYAGFATAEALQALWSRYSYNDAFGNADFYTSLVEFAGHQAGDNSIRFVGKVNDKAIDAYDKIDLLINVAGKSFTYPTSKVYKTLRGTVGESVVNVVTTTDSGANALILLNTDYLYGYGVTGIPAGEYTFEITPVGYIGETAIYGETVTLTAIVEDTAAVDTELAPFFTSDEAVAQLAPKATYDLAANITCNEAVKKVTYTSSNTSVATVDANGIITAVADGTAIITMTAVNETKSYAATFTVVVKTPWTPTLPNDIELYNTISTIGKLNNIYFYNTTVEVWSNTLQLNLCFNVNELDATKVAEHSFDIYLKESGSDEMGGYDKATIQPWSYYKFDTGNVIYRCKFFDSLAPKLEAGKTYEMVVVIRKGSTALAYGETSLTWTTALQTIVDGAAGDANVIK